MLPSRYGLGQISAPQIERAQHATETSTMTVAANGTNTNSPLFMYDHLLDCAARSGVPIEIYLRRELPDLWHEQYLAMPRRPNEVFVFTYETFDYIFDTYQQDEPYGATTGVLPVEARRVAAIGVSKPKSSARDDARLRGWPIDYAASGGPWDRGHFIGHSVGGIVDGNEANVFRQLRSVNRGRYRSMEKYCHQNPGVLCFSRPIYADVTAIPSHVEFGILKTDGTLWIEMHSNSRAL